LNLHYKIGGDSDHGVKFAVIGRRSSEILWRIKKK